ncbi:MAG TPA: spore coat protein [Firmicutes bacterium]|nr:spore coat protein [Bacillota bacterium]
MPTQRELTEISELIREQQDEVRKLSIMSQQCQDPRLRSMIESHENRFRNNISKLEGHLGVGGRGLSGRDVEVGTMGETLTRQAGPGQGQRLFSDRDIASDCLKDCKYFATRNTMAAAESSNPNLRNDLLGQSSEHLGMAYELYKFMEDKGWYKHPQARPEDVSQVSQWLRGQAPTV